jgi:hypothetical protein
VRNGSAGKLVLVVEVAVGRVAPVVSHGDRLPNRFARHKYAVGIELRARPRKPAVCARNLKSPEISRPALDHETGSDVGEFDSDLISFDAHRPQGRSERDDVLAVDDFGSRQCQAVRDVLFVSGMNVVFIAEIDRGRHAGVGQPKRQALRLPQFGPRILGWFRLVRLIARELHEQKRHCVAPLAAPIADQRRKQRAVLRRSIDIRIALVPEDALDSVRRERCNHAVE